MSYKEIRGRCPICGHENWCYTFDNKEGYNMIGCNRHRDKDNVMGLDGNFYVYVCETKNGGSSIYEEANQHLEREKQKEALKTENFKYAKREVKVLTPVDIVEPSSDHVWLSERYNAMLDMLILEDKHREYLKAEGWTDELIDKWKIKSLPVEDYVRMRDGVFTKNPFRVTVGVTLSEKFGDLSGLPGFFVNKKGKWTIAGQGGILFPLPDENGNFYRLRIRLDNAPKKGGKYRNLSSYSQDKEAEGQGFLVNKYYKGCQSYNNIGFYVDKSRDNTYNAYVTEGEKKSIIGEQYLRCPFVDIPGVNSIGKMIEGKEGHRPIDALKKMGVKIIIIAFDADFRTNQAVFMNQQRAVEIFKEEGFQIGIAEWDPELGKGIDDLLVGGYKPQFILA